MSVKSFLSKLKWNSKIAEGDDNMFIELKTATPLFMVYLQKKKLAFTPERRPGSPLSLGRTARPGNDIHPFPEETLAVRFARRGQTGVRDG